MFGFDTAYLGMIRAGELIAAFFSSAIEQIYVDAEIHNPAIAYFCSIKSKVLFLIPAWSRLLCLR
ncbi:hypothetical protein D5F53_28535 [Paenibacillus lautus]|uniref:Uncharacterized protein n=1 Tax=Paenibacillus lautus TaxID=1401 RepID=A0A385TUB6_PAELA|nr:hypothetical protein D5F53_28535 [Paenibacillus lautus]